MIEKKGKNTEKTGDESGKYFSEFINVRELSLLLGVSVGKIYNSRQNYDYSRIDKILINGRRFFNYYQAAKMAYPYLSDLDIAKLRLELHAKAEELAKRCSDDKNILNQFRTNSRKPLKI